MRESLFDDLKQLNNGAKNKLLDTCSEMNLSKAAIEGIEQAARLLMDFEQNGKKHLLTSAALTKKLGEISKRSDELRSLIVELSGFDRIQLHEAIVDEAMRKNLIRDRIVPLSGGVTTAIAHDLESLAVAAKSLQSKVAPKAKGGGRLKTFPSYFMILEWVWESVADEGFTLGRNGKFEKLCDAVFLAAGVHANAAGAVRKFAQEKPQQDEMRKQANAELWSK